MARPGRRPGGRDTRADILAAARTCFATSGYERTSLRQIARAAAVDPALVHHYFDGKAELFLAVMAMRRDPAAIVDEVQAAADKALALARAFIGDWEPRQAGDGPPPFATMMEAVCASPAVAGALREFLTLRVWSRTGDNGQPPGPNLRQALVTSQLWGLALARYILRIEPLASASADQAADWLALLLRRTFDLPLPSPPQPGPAGAAGGAAPNPVVPAPPAAASAAAAGPRP